MVITLITRVYLQTTKQGDYLVRKETLEIQDPQAPLEHRDPRAFKVFKVQLVFKGRKEILDLPDLKVFKALKEILETQDLKALKVFKVFKALLEQMVFKAQKVT
jgi:hypothetical protein